MDLVRERLDRMPEEGCGVHLAGLVVELDEGELRDAVDGEEHVDLAVGVAQLAAVDVDVTDRRLGEATALGHRLAGRQTRDAVAFEAAVQARSRQLRDLVAQAAHDVVQRQQCALAEGDDHRLLDRRQHRAAWVTRSHTYVGRACSRSLLVDRRPA